MQNNIQPLSLSDYTVAKGDTLQGIAKKFNLTPKFLASANSIKDPNKLSIGQNLIVASKAPALAAPSPARSMPVVPNKQPRLISAPALPGAYNIPPYINPLLQAIHRAESNVAGYETMVNSKANHGLTGKKLQEIIDYQNKYRTSTKSKNTGAAGAYQIIPSTMNELVSRLKLPMDTQFNKNTQDMMAYELLKNRGLYSYLQGKMPLSKFRVNAGKEWAGLPAIGSRSYYAKDKINKANISENEYLAALRKMKELYTSRK